MLCRSDPRDTIPRLTISEGLIRQPSHPLRQLTRHPLLLDQSILSLLTPAPFFSCAVWPSLGSNAAVLPENNVTCSFAFQVRFHSKPFLLRMYPPAHFGVSVIQKMTEDEERGRGKVVLRRVHLQVLDPSSQLHLARAFYGPATQNLAD